VLSAVGGGIPGISSDHQAVFNYIYNWVKNFAMYIKNEFIFVIV
jgi:hypothetical protein